ncbi:hypothetical protein V1291_004567 [Nitrobacteraceae bacterium AZCC 1564]
MSATDNLRGRIIKVVYNVASDVCIDLERRLIAMMRD